MKIIRVSGTPKDDFPKLNTDEKHKCFIKWKSKRLARTCNDENYERSLYGK